MNACVGRPGRRHYWGYRGVVGVLAALFVFCAAATAAWALPPTRDILPDGMTVIIQEDHAAPLVSVNIYVRVGSRDEQPGTLGLTHFYEHMFFRGTPTRSGLEMKKSLEALGGQVGAETTQDYTHFHVDLPSQYVEDALSIFGDALMHNHFDPKDIDLERKAVEDELSSNQSNQLAVLSNKLWSLAFQAHPYGRSVGATAVEVDRYTQPDFVAYKAKWYVPANVVLVVTGDVSRATLLPYLKRLFADYSGPASPPDSIPEEPPAAAVREFHQSTDLAFTYVLMGWRAPAMKDREDLYPMDVLVFLLGQGEGSLLRREIWDKQQLVWAVDGNFQTMKDNGLFVVSATVQPEKTLAARTAILEVIAQVREGKFTDEDLSRAKNYLVGITLFDHETNAGRAEYWGFYETVDSLDFALSYLDHIRKVTRDDVIRVAKKYLPPDRYVYADLMPHPPPAGNNDNE